MKTKPHFLLMLTLALGLSGGALAAESHEFPQISFVGAGGSKNPLRREEFLAVVVEGPFISYDKTPVPAAGEVDYVNNLLKTKGVSYIAVYTREGIKYGDLIRALDVLRRTNAKNVGVSMSELKPGREP